MAPLLLLLLLPGAARAQGPPPPPPPPPLTPLGAPVAPAGNPVTTARANLGKALFWDEQLSSNRTVACGSCHQAARGGSDPRSVAGSARALHPGPDGVRGTADDIVGSAGVVQHAADGTFAWSSLFGIGEQVTPRLAPSHVNAAYSPVQFWDGRATGTFVDPLSGATVLAAGASLESQVAGPPVSSVEMAHTGRDWAAVAQRVASVSPLALAADLASGLATWIAGRSYPELFAEAFGSLDVTPSRIAMAVAGYERTLFSTRAPLDSVIVGTAALTPQEAAGLQLFRALPCAGCHAGSLTTDNQFHYIGVRPAAEDSGRMVVTHQLADLGAMKTPSLRNVALRPSFMHDGRFRTLAEVVDFYDRGGDFNAPNKAPGIVPLNLTAAQKAQLVAFLSRPLTDPRVRDATAPFDQPSLYAESAAVPVLLAGGIAGSTGLPPQPVALEPALLGNPAFTVGVFGARGGAQAVLAIDDAEPDAGVLPATASFARVSLVLPGSGAGDGFASATIAIPDDPAQAGRTLYGRWYVVDPAAPGGVASSPAFRFALFGPHRAGASVVAVGETPAGGGSVRLGPSFPNPFVGSTTLRFDVLTATNVRVVVFDAAGRARRELRPRSLAAPGAYMVPWDGNDDDGRRVGPGVYFYRVESDRGVSSSRVVRLQ